MATSTNQCTPSARAWQLQLSSNSKKSIVPKTNVTVRPSGEACAARSRADEPGNERVVSIPTQDAASPASTCAGFVRDQMWTKCTGNDHITYRNMWDTCAATPSSQRTGSSARTDRAALEKSLQSSVVVLIPRTQILRLVLPTSLEARIVGIRLQHDVHAADGDSVHAAYERGDHRGGA